MSKLEEATKRLTRARSAYETAQSELHQAQREYDNALDEWTRTGPYKKLFHPESTSP